MIRDVSKLQHGPVDILVIGGGIYGSWIAFHAASAGLKVAIVEKSDWAGGTSSASSKLLHGGLRYLERFEFSMVRKSLHERRELSRRMPHHVRPLEFLLPVFRHSRVGRFRLKVGLWLYDLLAGSDQPVARHSSQSPQECLKIHPNLRSDNLVGGFTYGDCGTDDGRMVLEVVDSAQQAGAITCNYVSVTNLLRSGSRVIGATLRDEETNSSFDLSAAMVVNAAGPWVAGLLSAVTKLPDVRLTKGVHLVMPALDSEMAMLLTAKSDGRVFFLIPWYGRTLLGTTDTDYHKEPDGVGVTQADIDYLLTAANEYLQTQWTIADVHGAFCGLRTLYDDSSESASSVSREWGLDDSTPGLLTSIGGKYTSARVDAAAAVAEVFKQMRRTPNTALSEHLAWCSDSAFAKWQEEMCQSATGAGLDPETALNCTRRYGARIEDIISAVKTSAALARRIVPELPFCRAEVVHCVQHEMARTLCDVLRRRIPLTLLTRLQRQTVADVCDLAGDILEWDEARRVRETDAVLSMANEWQSANSASDAA